MITRKFLPIVQKSLRYNPACVLIGPRQSGKTTLARQILSLHPESVYFDLEDSRDFRKFEDPGTLFERYENSLVIIDKIQTRPELFRELRPAIDRNRKDGRFLLLGSASPVLITGVSEYLTGRVEYHEITPLTLSELPDITLREQHLMRGGFPSSLLAENDQNSRNWRKSYIQSYAQIELANIFGAGFNQKTVNNLWRMLAHLQGGLLNQSTLASSLGVTIPTVKRYIDYLAASFHLRLLEPWQINMKKRMVKSPKVYIRDSGLLHTLLDIETYDDLLGHPSAGQVWEGYVIEQIAGILDNRYSLYFYRTSNGAEADLVIARGLKPVITADIKFSNSPVPSRGFYESVRDLSPAKAFIIMPDGDDFPGKNDVTYCGLNKFLAFLSDYVSGNTDALK